MASTLSAELNGGVAGCLDGKFIGESLSPEVYSASIEGFNSEDRDDSIFFLEDKFMIEFMIAVVACVIGDGSSCGDDESIFCLDKELVSDSTEYAMASPFSVELNSGDIESTM